MLRPRQFLFRSRHVADRFRFMRQVISSSHVRLNFSGPHLQLFDSFSCDYLNLIPKPNF
jgi:hypothetical protein